MATPKARPISIIYSSLQAGLVSAASSIGITINPLFWSKTDYKQLILDTVATAMGIQEQLYDAHVSDVESIIDIIPPQTKDWIKQQMINLFEYNATTVPIVKLDTITFFPYYASPNPSNRIIKYCAVIPEALSTNTIKIAGDSSGSPVKISGSALSAAQTFINIVAIPGITYNVVSLDSDKIFMQLDVKYNGSYSAVIESNVISAINSFILEFSTNNFNGTLRISDLFEAIKVVEGVIDVIFVNIKARPDSTSVGGGTDLVLSKTWVNSEYNSVSGYMIPENTSGGNWRLTDYRVGSSGIKNLNLIAV